MVQEQIYDIKIYEIAVTDSTMPEPEANLEQVSAVNAKNAKGVAGTATLALLKYEGKYVWVRIKADAKRRNGLPAICA